jgi:hypothetical protein
MSSGALDQQMIDRLAGLTYSGERGQAHYLGAAVGVAPVVAFEGAATPRRSLDPTNRMRLTGAVVFGGVIHGMRRPTGTKPAPRRQVRNRGLEFDNAVRN